MSKQINGMSFELTLGEYDIHAEKFSLDITDNSAAVKKNGRPDGHVDGDVEASGEIEIDASGLKVIMDVASSAGSFQSLPTFDIVAYAKIGELEVKVEAFECKLKISKILDVDKSSSDPTKFVLPFIVTGKDFVRVNGTSIIDQDEESE